MSRAGIRGPGGQGDPPPESTMAGSAAGKGGASVYRLDADQLDAMDRLLRMIAAHGDIVATVRAADLAPGTLPVIGQAIHDHARAVCGILEEMEAQRPGHAAGGREGVDEMRADYAARPLRPVARCQRARLH